MPRKMYRNPEAEPTPERPGSGSPDDSGVRRRPRKEEESVIIDPEYQRAVERVKSKEPNVIVEPSYQEEIGRSKRARKSAEKPKEETLTLEEARTRFETVEQELKEMGVTSEADKMNDPEWLKASAALRHAERASRAERGKRGVREYKEAQARREERQAGHQAAVRELVEEYGREEAAKHEGVQENVDELLAMERERMAEEAKVARRERLAGMKKQTDQMRVSLLNQERADLRERMEKMGGVWAGEEYFKLQDRLEDVDAELEKLGGAERKPTSPKREAPTRVTEEAIVAGELTPEDEIADARKTLKFINDSEKEIAARQKALQSQLSKHGIRSAAQIDAELAEMEPELRAASTGAKPDMWYRLKKVGRRLAGLERSPEVQALLKTYVQLENEMNAQIHSRAEAEAQLVEAEKKAGRERPSRRATQAQIRSLTRQPNEPLEDYGLGLSDIPGMVETFREAPEMRRGSKELRTTLALKKIEEDIRGALGEMEAMQELTETELSEEMFEEKKSNFAKRIRALEEEGKSEAFDQALEEAEEALMRYVMAVHQRRQKFEEEARAAGKGEARPRSVIAARAGRAGSYGTASPDRRVVRLQELKTPDTREREAAVAPESVNKEVEMYRSVKWRKGLIDKINTDENARRAMHGIYEAFKHRMLEKLANEEEVDFRTGSPDPALDYALNLYRKYARRADGKGYVYDLKIRHAAHGELEDIERVLGKNWDKSGWAAQAVRAISRGKVELPTESSYEEFRAIEPEGEGADVIPLPHVKRALSEEELEEVEEMDIPVTVEAPMTEAEALAAEEIPIEVEASVSAKERPVVSAETAEQEALAEASERQRKIDEEAEQSFEASLGGFRPAGEVLSEPAAKEKETAKRREPAWERGIPFDSPEQEEAVREEIEGLMREALKNEEKALELQYLSKYKPDQDSSLADAMVSLYMNAVTARPGARKRVLRADLEQAWAILSRKEQNLPAERSEEEIRMEKIESRIKGIKKNKARMSALRKALEGITGDSLTNRVDSLFAFYESAEGARKEALGAKLDAARAALGYETLGKKKTGGTTEGQVIEMEKARKRLRGRKNAGT